MPLHRIRLRLDGPLGTPLSSGTLFGHVCWAMLRRQGEAALEAWLAALSAGETRFLLSDAVPKGLLPRPVLPQAPVAEQAGTRDADAAKRRRKARWVRRGWWLRNGSRISAAVLDSENEEALVDWKPAGAVHAHNRIDRVTGTTPETAGLWLVEDDWSFFAAPERDLYVDSDLPVAEVERLLAEVGAQGYGRDATYGRGRFRIESVEEDRELLAHSGNRMLSLSHGCLSASMQEPRYERFTHFGKVAIELALTGARPFKRPVLLMKPGATFRPEGEGPFGALLGGVHQDDEKVVHHAFHLAIPYTEAAG